MKFLVSTFKLVRILNQNLKEKSLQAEEPFSIVRSFLKKNHAGFFAKSNKLYLL